MKTLVSLTALVSATLATAAFSIAGAQSISLWTTEEQPDRLAKQEALAADFEAETGISVSVIPVSESELGTRATAAAAAGDLPDVIYYPLQYALPWAEAGIIDVDATSDAVAGLGADTFRSGALNMAAADGGFAGVPVDGWTQLVVYRKDLFDANGLEAPTSYANVLAAMEALKGQVDYGFIAPNKVDEGFMSQVLEHVLLANGVTPVNKDGLAELDPKATTEALEFYKAIVDASPEGELYWKQSREGYFAGQTAMIIWSPFILDELAGLRDSAPPTINDDPTTRDLAAATGIVTTFGGPSNPDGAAWADVRYLGVTADADADSAISFIEYSLNDGYGKTLSIAPEGKFPVRPGATAGSTEFVDLWSTLPVGVDRKAPLADLYPADVIESIAAGLETASRWGVTEGQLALASKINNSRVLNVLVREYIDGVRDAAATVAMMNEELAKID
jgi:multiple sugar transport system substrate-binding protein